jgi:hypothetical protein
MTTMVREVIIKWVFKRPNETKRLRVGYPANYFGKIAGIYQKYLSIFAEENRK